ncbi:MAG TPA: LacI family DNA-binding transcriptional regulator [Beutenbergiaceae bacterium]|nr:LacI family DNA-binding transcriptional regulator [Beutenbergiaceae bacterium]
MVTTIHDVARRSGVSIATVSRALAGSSGVAPATRQKVQRIAADLGYQPNRAARQLVTGQGQAIGLVVPDLENPFYAAVTKGVQRRARQAGFTAVVADTDEDVPTEREVLGQLGTGVDRIILASPRGPDQDLLELGARCRLTLLNRQIDTDPLAVPAVVPDNIDGMDQAIRHLRALGHRQIGYAGGPVTSWSDAQRRTGLPSAGDGDVQIIDLGAFRPGRPGGVAAADEAIAAGVSAVLAFNDQLALGILGRLADRQVEVPEQMSVIGFDDVPVARLLQPALTTVAVPAQQMGAQAVDLVLGPDPAEAALIVQPVQLQVRRSTAVRPSR